MRRGHDFCETRKSEACRFDWATEGQVTPKAIRFIGHEQEHPTISPKAERLQTLVDKYNEYSQHTILDRCDLHTTYYKSLKPKLQIQWRECLNWFAERLPLSRTEALLDGVLSEKVLLKTRIWKYGPWATLVYAQSTFQRCREM